MVPDRENGQGKGSEAGAPDAPMEQPGGSRARAEEARGV